MWKCYHAGKSSGRQLKDYEFRDYIQSLQKVPKYIVMESILQEPVIYGSDNNIVVPKLIINSEGRQEGIIKEIIYE